MGDDALTAADYPDVLDLHGTKVAASYRFEPGVDDDGVTLTLPLVLLPQLDPGELEWTIPGWQAEKIAALLQDLPKATRKEIADSAGTVVDVARDLTRRLVPFRAPLLPALARALSALIPSRVTADLFRPETVPRHLRFSFRIVGEGGKTVAEGRDLGELQARFGARAPARRS